MAKWILVFALLAGFAAPSRAGDEDKKQEKAVAVPQEAQPAPAPEEAEAPDMSLGSEPDPVSPEFAEEAGAILEEPSAPVKRKIWDPDANLDYSELLGLVDPTEASRGVLPPALGARGYRPNLIAVGGGDRMPGYGGLLEYSWNRLGAGIYYSYRSLKGQDTIHLSQSFGGIYGLYRWLPWKFSPYFLVGLEMAQETPESFGGLAGVGMEAQVYSGWTFLLGYTYHSTVRKGFMGGAVGWAF